MDLVFEKWGGDASEMIKNTEDNKQLTATKEAEVQEARAALYSRLEVIGNLVHDSVPVSNDEVCINYLIYFRCFMGFVINLFLISSIIL